MQPRAELAPPPSPATVVFQLVTVIADRFSVVVRTMSGDEVIILPDRGWPTYTVMRLREQLAALGQSPNGRIAGMPARSLAFHASFVRVLLGDRIIASNQLVAAFAEPSLFDYELWWARPPAPGRELFFWELAVRQPATRVTYGLLLRPIRFRHLTCRVLTWLINTERDRGGFEPEDLPGYSNDGLPSPGYWELRWAPDGQGSGGWVWVDPDAEGLAQAAPVSRIVAEGRVMPPDMPVRVLLEHLWGDAPGSWASPDAGYNQFLGPDDSRFLIAFWRGFGMGVHHTPPDLQGWRELYPAASDIPQHLGVTVAWPRLA